MASVELNIQGLDELNKKLKQLGNSKIAKRIARKAGRQAMNLVRDAARNNAKAIDDPQSAEKIWKNISTQGGKTRNSSEVKIRVGVRGGASFSNPNPPQLSGGDTRHWRWIEFGSSNNPAVPFMRPALENNITQVTAKFVDVFGTEIDKEIANL